MIKRCEMGFWGFGVLGFRVRVRVKVKVRVRVKF